MAARLAQNHARTQKADSGQDALRHSTNGVRVSQSAPGRLQRSDGGSRRAEADQAVRSESRSFAVKLPIQPQQATREQRHDQTNCNLLVRGCHQLLIEPNSSREGKPFVRGNPKVPSPSAFGGTSAVSSSNKEPTTGNSAASPPPPTYTQ